MKADYEVRYWIGVIKQIAYLETSHKGDGYDKIIRHCEEILRCTQEEELYNNSTNSITVGAGIE